MLSAIPILGWRGPQFLLFFLGVVVVAVCWNVWRLRSADRTRGMVCPKISPKLDPFEVAFLRGGPPELTRLIILDLISRKYFARIEETGTRRTVSKIERAKDHPDPNFLSAPERFVFDWLSKPSEAKDIMAALPSALESRGCLAGYKSSLENQNLLRTNEDREARWSATLLPLGLLGVLGGGKVLFALSTGHSNVGFLILLILIGSGVILLTAATGRRLTSLGVTYLERLQHGMESLQKRIGTLASAEPCDQFLLAVAIFGMTTLSGTSYGYYPTMFQRSVQNGSGCGSSCGSSCSSGGSSCGSSCGGGCGGGGCGGCGS